MIVVLVNLNYQIGVHINFAQSRMPALVCNLQSDSGCHQARSQGGQCPPNPKVFRLVKYLKYKPKKYFSSNQRNCLKECILLQLLVEYKLVAYLTFCNQ